MGLKIILYMTYIQWYDPFDSKCWERKQNAHKTAGLNGSFIQMP